MQIEIVGDEITPVLAYARLGGPGCCLLESAHDAGHDKISLLGLDPIATFKSVGHNIEIEREGKKESFTADPYDALKEFSAGKKVFGFISYEGNFFFHIYRTTFHFDHAANTIVCNHEGDELTPLLEKLYTTQSLKPLKNSRKTLSFEEEIKDEEFFEWIEQTKEHLRAGDVFQLVLSRTFTAEVKSSPFQIYRALRQVSPAPYHFFFEEKEFAIAGASPEKLISVQNGLIESSPIAGTSPKGVDPAKFLADPKEAAEHVMLVDLARNDVGAVSTSGSVRVAEYGAVQKFSHLQHIVSRVVGTLKSDLHALDALKASFPAGTLSGAPKVRAMQLIGKLERSPRGVYGGAVVTLDEQGNLLSCIVIRTAVMQNGKAEVRAGCGIVLASDPQKEADETRLKTKGVREALELAEGNV